MNEQIFIKRFSYNDEENYPDYGCNFETFTNADFLECESLGGLKTLEKGDIVQLSENWELVACNEDWDYKNEESIACFVEKFILE